MTKTPSYSLLDNMRFYILASSVLLSVAVVSWLRLHIAGDQLVYIRAEQFFGLLCILYWYLALVISPLGYVIGKQRLTGLTFARRAIGVSAAYFALLHMAVSFWGQLGGFAGISLMPSYFRWSLLGGIIALLILAAMAATSFDAVIRFMTFKRWKLLHQLVYIGGILAVLHVWSIGTHLSYSGVQIAAFVALAVISGLETYRTVKLLAKRFAKLQQEDYFTALFLGVWAVIIAAILLLPLLMQSYHGKHHTAPVPTSYIEAPHA
jgi:sulfoxide reductase heme-binding subunit YedZ